MSQQMVDLMEAVWQIHRLTVHRLHSRTMGCTDGMPWLGGAGPDIPPGG